jgi:hypothetical protein
MAAGSIKYKDGYKYQLFEECQLEVSVTPGTDIESDYIDLNTQGMLVIKKGYAWDGASGPAWDSKNIMRGSLVHDALYQLMRNGKVGQEQRIQADKELRRLCLEDGMWKIRAWWVYTAVRLFGGGAVSSELKKPVLTAP